MKGELFKRVTSLLSAAAMLLTYADFSAIDFSVHAENGDEAPELVSYDVNGNGKIDDGEENWGYELDSADDLFWFADKVNNDNDNYGEANAVLTNDITVNSGVLDENGELNEGDFREWTPVGKWTSEGTQKYKGTFDGKGHTVSGLYFNDNSEETGRFVGLFGDISGTVKNVGIIESYFCGNTYIGGICGYSEGGKIKNCYNTGTVKGVDTFGGICGETLYGEITNCYNTGDVTLADSYFCGSAYVGGVCSSNFGATISNCYYLNTVAEDLYATAMTAQQFASGEVCWLLNGGETQAETPVFFQNIDKEAFPVLDSTHNMVYKNKACDGVSDYYNHENKDQEHSFDENGFCTICDGYQPATTVKDVYDIDGDGETSDDVYEISNAGQLYWFADKVNNDNDNYGEANAVLTNDITVNSGVLDENGELIEGDFREWTNHGSQWYQGTFDGAGYTISGLYFNKSDATYVGLFGLNFGTIENVNVTDSYFCGSGYVCGICGYNKGTIENCSNTGKVVGCFYAGGICGENATNGAITNCYNTGDVTATDAEASVGGVCGNNNGTITNCYNTGDVIATDEGASAGGVCGKTNAAITNCYYLADTDDGNGGKTASQFASGEVCWLLNGGETQAETPVFFQNIDKEAFPVLDSTHNMVYKNKACDGVSDYYNHENKDQEHSFDENGFCTICDGYQPATTVKDVYDIDGDGETSDDVYEISNAGQLYWFAGLVNGTLGDVKQIRYANAVLKNDITVNSGVLNENGELNEGDFRVWTPIGYYDSVNKKSYSYCGAFDGAGHTISGLYFNDSGAAYVGLFGFVSNGESKNKIMNLTVADSYFCGNKNVGGVCGLNYLVTIQNCSNTGKVTGDEYVGGVCGYISKRVIENCYNTGKVSGNSYIGGICGYNCEKNTIQNCYNTGAVSGDTIVGGICGKVDYTSLTSNAYKMVTNCYNTGKVKGNTYVGSINGIGESKLIENCYYLGTEGVQGRGTGDDKAGSTEVKSGEQFASGEVCWLLNGGETQVESPAFFQNIDKEAFPVLDSKHHTVVEKDGAYSNEHNFESEICTICGAFEDGMGARLAGHSLTLDGSIGVNFYMVLDESVAEDENAYMRFTLPNGKTENVNVSQAEKKNVNDMECYVFKCNVAAKEMTATIKAQMFSNGKQGTVYEYTVKEYADYLFANAYEDDGTTVKNNEYAKAYALVEAMVNYGAYSQIYFDYNTEFLANAGRTDNVSTVTAENVNKPYDKTKNNLPDGVSLVSANLELESETVLNLLFTNTTDKELTFKTSDDVTLTQTMTDDGIKVTITNIAAQYLSEDIIVNISVDGDTASYSAMYSPMNYCYSVLSKETTETRTDELKNVMRAFWLYNQQAKAYFQNN